MSLLGPDGRPVAPTSIRKNEEEGWEISTTIPNIHDSEIKEFEKKVLEPALERQGLATDLDSWRNRIIERSREIGFVVDVLVFSTTADGRNAIPGLYAFDFVLKRRLKEFDPDRQVHEVTNDILGLGDKGVIKTDHGVLRDLMDGDPSAEMPKPES
jgi:hypothetical protein